MVMRGLTWSTLKETPSLIPLFVILGVGVSGAIFYPLRCALKSPDVTWNRSKNPEPWNEYANKHYKVFLTIAVGLVISNIVSQREWENIYVTKIEE